MRALWDFGIRQAQRRQPRAKAACARGPQSAFTLVELLIVMAILAILAALLLGVAARAGERGREARTKSMIARLHTLVTEHYDTYKHRRAPVRDDVAQQIKAQAPAQWRGQAVAEARLYALRELMVLEMPDRWSDVWLTSLPGNATTTATLPTPASPLYLASPTSSSPYGGPTVLNEVFRRQCASMIGATNSITGERNTVDNILDNQGAECLYMIVMFATADGEARSLFNESSIGDVDGDGAPEFLDGWGRPINFLRWAPGYESDLQYNANEFADNEVWLSQVEADHDPFDLFRRDPFAFRLVPLIFSAGGDESYGIRTIKPSVTWRTANFSMNPRTWAPGRTTYLGARLTPYQKFSGDDDGVDTFYGTVRDDTAADNINNHSIASE